MAPTEWDFRNKLLAVLSAARHKGMPYVDVESGKLLAELGGDSKSNLRMPKCHDIMTRMMRPGDSILQETQNGDRMTMLVRYMLKAKREH
jgi:hypothetical protein